MSDTSFVQLTGISYDEPVLVNPRYVVAVQGSYLHLFGAGITVKEPHEKILRLFAAALGYDYVPHSDKERDE